MLKDKWCLLPSFSITVSQNDKEFKRICCYYSKIWYHRLTELTIVSSSILIVSSIQQGHFTISDTESLSDLSPGNQNSRPFFIAFIYFYSDHIESNEFTAEYLKMHKSTNKEKLCIIHVPLLLATINILIIFLFVFPTKVETCFRRCL